MYISLTDEEFKEVIDGGFKPFLAKVIGKDYTYHTLGLNEDDLYEIEIPAAGQPKAGDTGKES